MRRKIATVEFDDHFWIIAVRAAGILHLVTLALACFTPIPPNWDENLARLPEVHRRVAVAQNAFIGAVMVAFGLVSLLLAPLLEHTERAVKLKAISHHGLSLTLCEKMVMLHSTKRSLNHHVAERMRSIEAGHLHAQPLPHAQVPCFLSDLLIETKQSRGDPCHRPLTRTVSAVLVSIDAPSQIEHPLLRCIDHGF